MPVDIMPRYTLREHASHPAFRFVMHTRLQGLLLVITLGWTFGQATPTAQDKQQLRMLNSPLLVNVAWRGGTGREVVYLRNDSQSAIPCVLSATVGAAQKTSRTTVVFLDAKGKPIPAGEVLLARETTTPVPVAVSEALDSNESEASIFCNGGTELGKLRLWRMPFSITLDEPVDKLGLSLVDGEESRIVLKNDDPVEYPIAWELIVGHSLLARSEALQLQAKGVTVLTFKPAIPFGVRDLLKPHSADAELLLFYNDGSDTAETGTNGDVNRTAPVKRFPVKAALSHFGVSSRDTWSYVVIVSILILGGVVSLVLTHALPNRLEALDIREKLNAIARTTADLSSHVDSRVAVLVRVERIRLQDLLRSRTTVSPDFANNLQQCRAGLAQLGARVSLLQQIDLIYGRLSKLATRPLPPSRVVEVVASIEKAQVFLQKAEPSDADLQAAQAATSDAAQKANALDQPDPGFGQTLAARVQDLLNGIKSDLDKRPTFVRISTAVPGPLRTLQTVNAAIAIPPERCAGIDMAVEKMTLMCEYATLADGTMDRAILGRLQANEVLLLGHLQLDSLEALRAARLLMREMKEDIYPVRIEQALLANPMEVVIEMDPLLAYDRSPLTFGLCFSSVALNSSTAREEWTCDWDFGDGLVASGRSVSHYFQLPRAQWFARVQPKTFEVTAVLRNPEGHAVIDPATQQPVVVRKKVTVLPTKLTNLFGERTWVEGLKLAAALLVAVFALVSGAKDELLKLDLLPGLVAVFLVGFTADTVKNLLTSK